MRMGQIQTGDKHSAVVQEALKKMAEEEDDPGQKKEEDTGPKIKMGKIGKGKKGKKRGTAGGDAGNQESYTKKLGGVGIGDVDPRPSGALNEQDIEFMKKAIQILCQSTNPLGKSIDFVTDDVDSMSKEYEHWRKEAIQCNQALEEQQKITEEVVQPLQDSLAELEEQIREQ